MRAPHQTDPAPSCSNPFLILLLTLQVFCLCVFFFFAFLTPGPVPLQPGNGFDLGLLQK